MQGLRQFLGDLAFVTSAGATAVLDCFDPEAEQAADRLGCLADPPPGLADPVIHFEYEGDVDETHLFRLFNPDRIRAAVIGTPWDVAGINRSPDTCGPHYRVAVSNRAPDPGPGFLTGISVHGAPSVRTAGSAGRDCWTGRRPR